MIIIYVKGWVDMAIKKELVKAEKCFSCLDINSCKRFFVVGMVLHSCKDYKPKGDIKIDRKDSKVKR